MVQILDETKGDLISIKIKGKLTKGDFDVFNPILEKTIRDFEKPKIYIEIHEIDMPEFQAIWEDIKNIPKYNRLEKIAVVGIKGWYEQMTIIFSKIISPEVKYFDYDQKKNAKKWLESYSYHTNTQ
ncbi:MAG: STAS/SEC14 domain-containing protein [Bacteroidetes bacterium]|nr:STAS/SEC14 domain-containing protein [Bacteroidota bacterium]HET6243006.1 STAS/SEC14 domain-containing protein [Bacteroidia bacterium]